MRVRYLTAEKPSDTSNHRDERKDYVDGDNESVHHAIAPHGTIFRVMLDLARRSEPIDLVTLAAAWAQ